MITAVLTGTALLLPQGQDNDPALVDARLLQGKLVLQLLGQAAPDPDPREPVLRELLRQLEDAERRTPPRADVIAMADQVARKLIELAPGNRGDVAFARLATSWPADPSSLVATRTWEWLHVATQACIEDTNSPVKAWIETVQRHAGGASTPLDASGERSGDPEAARATFLASAGNLVSRRAKELTADDHLVSLTFPLLCRLGVDTAPLVRELTRDMPAQYERLLRLPSEVTFSQKRVPGLAYLSLPGGTTLVRAIRVSPLGLTEVGAARLCDLGMSLVAGYHRLDLRAAGREVTAIVRVPAAEESIVLPALNALEAGSWLFMHGGKQAEAWALRPVTGVQLANGIHMLPDQYDKPVKDLLQSVTAALGPVRLARGDARTLAGLCANHNDLCTLPDRDLGHHLEDAKDLLAPLGISASSRVLTSGGAIPPTAGEAETYVVLHARRLP